MNLFRGKRSILLSILLLLLGGFFLVSFIASQGLTILTYPYTTVFTEKPLTKLLKNQKALGEIHSQSDYLGIIAIRFHTFAKINDDTIIFGIKEKGQKTWYAESRYVVDQFQPDDLFTFGFPVIADSQDKTYSIELQSVKGTPKNAVALSPVEPVLVTKHQFPKAILLSNTSVIKHFLFHKVTTLLTNPGFLLYGIASFLPFLLYVFACFFLRPQTKQSMYLKKNASRITRKIDTFFLLHKNRNFPELDGIRAWAISMVIMAHIGPWLASMVSDATNTSQSLVGVLYTFFLYLPFIGIVGGGTGVDMFFVLSGFLIFMTILKNKPSFWKFMIGRYRRLLPAHLVLLLGLLSTITIVGMLLNIFFLVEFFPYFQNLNLLTWTLNYEIVFYLLCSIWLIWGKRNSFLHTWKFFFLFALVLYVSPYFLTDSLAKLHIKYLDMNRFFAFFFGVALAKMYFLEPTLWKRLQQIFLYAGIPGLLIITLFKYTWGEVVLAQRYGVLWMNVDYLILDVGIFFLVGSLLVTKTHFLKRLFGLRLLRILGVISYSLYLFHYNFGLPIAKSMVNGIFFTPVKMLAFIIAGFVVSIIFSIFLFHYLEKPYFLRKRSRTYPKIPT